MNNHLYGMSQAEAKLIIDEHRAIAQKGSFVPNDKALVRYAYLGFVWSSILHGNGVDAAETYDICEEYAALNPDDKDAGRKEMREFIEYCNKNRG